MANTYQATFKRYEIKYLLTDSQYRGLRERLRGMAEVDSYGRTSILNIYYDTPDFGLIRRSLEKPEYKEKLRLRTYGTPGSATPGYVEIKKKYDGIVYKRRVGMQYETALAYMTGKAEPEIGSDNDAQIVREVDYFRQFYRGLRASMAVSYDRIAMAGIEDPELRITFDENIRYRTEQLDLRYGNTGAELLSPGQHLMELKVSGAIPLELAHILSELMIFPCSYSKYGRGYVDMMNGRAPGRKKAA